MTANEMHSVNRSGLSVASSISRLVAAVTTPCGRGGGHGGEGVRERCKWRAWGEEHGGGV